MTPLVWLAIFGTMAGYYAWEARQRSLNASAYVVSDAAPADAFTANAPDWGQTILYDFGNLVGLNPQVSPGMAAYIMATETFSPVPYLDPPGNTQGRYSIGYGHQIQPGESFWPYGGVTRISADQAATVFDSDVARAGDVVSRLVTVPLTQGQFDALTDFVYNEGQSNFASSTLLAKLNQGDYYGAAAEFKKWIYAGGRALNSLVARRQYDAQVFVG